MTEYHSTSVQNLRPYMMPGLETIVSEEKNGSANLSTAAPYVEQSTQTEASPNYSPSLGYSVQGWDKAKGMIVKFLSWYDMPLRDWIRGRISFGRPENNYEVVINAEQVIEEASETTKHEVAGHGADLGASEERITNMAHKEIYDR